MEYYLEYILIFATQEGDIPVFKIALFHVRSLGLITKWHTLFLSYKMGFHLNNFREFSRAVFG